MFVLAEMILHSLLAYRRKKAGVPSVRKLSTVLLMDAMQFPLSLIFTRFLNVFGAQIPDLASDCAGTFWGTLPGQVLFLLIAIVLTGVGAALSLDMRLIPNPGDGIVQTLSDFSGGSVGLIQKLLRYRQRAVDLCHWSLDGRTVGGDRSGDDPVHDWGGTCDCGV